MPAQPPVPEPARSRPGGQPPPVPGVPEPDLPSPLHPEAPGPGDRSQVVAAGTDQVRRYLAQDGMPADEVDRLIAEARGAGTVAFARPRDPERPAEQLRLSCQGEAIQLTIENAGAAG
jgi:hypothetical protein